MLNLSGLGVRMSNFLGSKTFQRRPINLEGSIFPQKEIMLKPFAKSTSDYFAPSFINTQPFFLLG